MGLGKGDSDKNGTYLGIQILRKRMSLGVKNNHKKKVLGKDKIQKGHVQ